MTTLDERDLQILILVSRFQQLTSNHIHDLVFHESQSKHPAYTALRRQVERGNLKRINRLLPGGAKGGSGQAVYVVTKRGWDVANTELPYRRIDAENYHSLAIADLWVSLVKQHRAGKLAIGGYATEPESHLIIGQHWIKPDLYVELDRPQSVRLMFEVDMGTQSDKQIRGKIDGYLAAYKAATDDVWPHNQRVVFYPIHDERADRLRRLLASVRDEDDRSLFEVRTAGKLSTS